jgi:hypothetical protein
MLDEVLGSLLQALFGGLPMQCTQHNGRGEGHSITLRSHSTIREKKKHIQQGVLYTMALALI